MSPFDTLTPEQQMQVLIVRIDIILEWVGYVLRIALPVTAAIVALTVLIVKLRRRRMNL